MILVESTIILDISDGNIGIYVPIGSRSEPYPTRIYLVTIYPTADNVGDYMYIITAPDTVVGVLTSGVSGGTGLSVNPTAATNIKSGFLVNLYSGVTGQDLG